MLLEKGKEPPAVRQPWEAMELSGSVQVTRSTSTCCSLPGASRLGPSGPSALPSPEQPLCSLPGSRRAFPTLLGPAGLSRTGTAAADGVSGAGRQPPAGHRGHTCVSPLNAGGCGGRGSPPCATAPAQSREPAVPGAVACSSGENFSALPLRRLQSTNHSIYCFFSPQHRSSHIGLWGESGSNVLCHLQITRAFEKTPPPPPQSTPTPRPLHTQKSVKMSPEAWLPQPTLLLTGLTLLLSLGKCRLEPPCMCPAGETPVSLARSPLPVSQPREAPCCRDGDGGGLAGALRRATSQGDLLSGRVGGTVPLHLLLKTPCMLLAGG